MKKIRLDLDALDVDSFATSGEPDAPRGTVRGQSFATSFFTLDNNASCYGMCGTMEYHTCSESQPTVGPSCDYFCQAQTVGCYPPPETEMCG